MTTLDIITIVLFSLGVVLVGLAFSRKGKSMQSFFAANGTMPWYMSGLSLFMGFFSAGTFVVWGSIAYSMGWVSITIQWTMAGSRIHTQKIRKVDTEDIHLPVLVYLCVSYGLFPLSGR
jgi:Na+/proline symporter